MCHEQWQILDQVPAWPLSLSFSLSLSLSLYLSISFSLPLCISLAASIFLCLSGLLLFPSRGTKSNAGRSCRYHHFLISDMKACACSRDNHWNLLLAQPSSMTSPIKLSNSLSNNCFNACISFLSHMWSNAFWNVGMWVCADDSICCIYAVLCLALQDGHWKQDGKHVNSIRRWTFVGQYTVIEWAC